MLSSDTIGGVLAAMILALSPLDKFWLLLSLTLLLLAGIYSYLGMMALVGWQPRKRLTDALFWNTMFLWVLVLRSNGII